MLPCTDTARSARTMHEEITRIAANGAARARAAGRTSSHSTRLLQTLGSASNAWLCVWLRVEIWIYKKNVMWVVLKYSRAISAELSECAPRLESVGFRSASSRCPLPLSAVAPAQPGGTLMMHSHV